jgi:hypothetical protein
VGLLLSFSSLRFGCIAFAVGRPVQNADRIGFEFDDELLHNVLDDFLAVRNFDRAIVFAGGQFALYEDVSAFDETFRQFGKSIAECICYVESTRPLENRNTLGMLHFFLKLVCFLGGCRCM